MKIETTLLTKLTIPLNSQTPPFIVASTNHTPLTNNKLNNKTEYTDAKENELSTYFPLLTGTTSTKGLVLLSTIGCKSRSWILALTRIFMSPVVTIVNFVFI
jgi:hypothetical protein